MKLNKTEARINKNGKLSVGSDDMKKFTIINPIKGTLDEKMLGVIKNILEVNNTYIFKIRIKDTYYYCTCGAPKTDALNMIMVTFICIECVLQIMYILWIMNV